jgi:hypothetical protein
MDLGKRIERYKAIEAYRKRPLIVYATSTRNGVFAVMAGDAVREFVDQIDAIKDGDAVDVLVHSYGGDALTAWRLMSMLRARFKQVDVLVPLAAFSAATIFALGADEIIMHPFASLGPIDPQITARQPDGSMKQFAYEDLGSFIRFLSDELKLKGTKEAESVSLSPEHVRAVVEKLFASVDPVAVGQAKRASDLSAQVGERLLLTHMKDETKARKIALNLNKSFFAHGDAVSRKRARDLDLNIAKDDPALEALLWDAYLGIESYLDLRHPYLPLDTYMADQAAAEALAPTGPIRIPNDTPPQLAMQIWNQVVAGIMANQSKAPQVPYAIKRGLIESPRLAMEESGEGMLCALRQPNGEVKVIFTERSGGWRVVNTPTPGPT